MFRVAKDLCTSRYVWRPVFQRWMSSVTGLKDHNQRRTMECHNGEKVKPTFSAQEMQRRLDMLRVHMETNQLDACVFTSLHNIHYFSDFLYCQFGRQYGLVVTPTKTVSVSAGIDYGQPWRRTFGDNVVYTDWQRDNYFYAVKTLVGDAKNVGFEFDFVSLDNHRKFSDALPNANFVDVGQATMRMRMLKSQEEIDLIRNGARIADLGGEAVVKAIKEDTAEYEVALASTDVMVREIAATYPHTEIRDTWTWFQTGVNTDGGHNPVTTRRIQKGDIISLNCFPMIAGYYTALERTLFYDHVPTDRHMEIWEVNCKVHRRGLELIKPGVRCSEIAKELNELFLQHNLLKYRTFGYGHSFGVLCHYYGREAGLEIREDVETVLQPNMVVSMEPMVTIPEGEPGAGGYREHNILVVMETGSEDITKFPFGPEKNVIKN
ncbi:creatinase-like [Montipora capricornis]|uniref:creatinase-like n=1 Tax=Montipora capricornis TaxID=246305 RepID=UPI0035F20D57